MEKWMPEIIRRLERDERIERRKEAKKKREAKLLNNKLFIDDLAENKRKVNNRLNG